MERAEWHRATIELVDELLARADAGAGRFGPEDLVELPEPVVRYFRFALREGQPYVRSGAPPRAATAILVADGSPTASATRPGPLSSP